MTESGKREKPLFLPLRKEHFESFRRGDKDTEYRLHGRRWNGITCRVGRTVVLSCGYSGERLNGVVSSFHAIPLGSIHGGLLRLSIKGCFPTADDSTSIACIGIRKDTDNA